MTTVFNILLGFPIALIKIAGLGINRKLFDYHTQDSVFTAVNSSRNSYFFLAFYGMMSILILSGFIMLIQGEQMSIGLAVVGFVIHPTVGIIGLRKFLWLIRGKENLRIEDGKLTIKKTGTFWTKEKVFQLSDINNVRSKFETETFLSQPRKLAEIILAIKELQRVFLSFTIGEIEFDHKRNKVRVFNDLTDDERKTVIENIKHYLQHHV